MLPTPPRSRAHPEDDVEPEDEVFDAAPHLVRAQLFPRHLSARLSLTVLQNRAGSARSPLTPRAAHPPDPRAVRGRDVTAHASREH